MSEILKPLPLSKGRSFVKTSKLIADGKAMYDHARHVIVLNDKGEISELFENPPFVGVVDCLVVLVPFVKHHYRGTKTILTVVLEIGLRRFVPYAVTEYRPSGKRERTPRKWGERKNNSVLPRASREPTVTIGARVRVAELSDHVLFDLLPTIAEIIQKQVDGFLAKWESSKLIQTMGPKNRPYEKVVSIFVRVHTSTPLLCAAVRFREFEYRSSEKGNIFGVAELLRRNCAQFIARHTREIATDGEYLDSVVKDSTTASFIAAEIAKRILYRGYCKRMIETMLEMIGKPDSKERQLINQIWRVHKIPQALVDEGLAKIEEEYGDIRHLLLNSWPLQGIRRTRYERQRVVHARNCLTFSIFGSHEELEKMMVEFDRRKDYAKRAEEAAKMDAWKNPSAEVEKPEDQDADIPF